MSKSSIFSVSSLPLLWELRGYLVCLRLQVCPPSMAVSFSVLTLTLIRCQAHALSWCKLEGTGEFCLIGGSLNNPSNEAEFASPLKFAPLQGASLAANQSQSQNRKETAILGRQIWNQRHTRYPRTSHRSGNKETEKMELFDMSVIKDHAWG